LVRALGICSNGTPESWPELITLQESLRGVFYAPFYAALTLDAFGQEGVEVRFVSSPTPAQALDGLMAGTVDVGWGGPMRVNEGYQTIPAADFTCFAEVVTRDPFFLVTRDERPAFTPLALMDQRLATVSEVPTPWLCLQHDIRLAGLDPAAITRVADRSMADNVAALRRGEVDVVQLFAPFVEELVEDGFHIWYAAADRGPCSYTTFYTRRSTIARKREELTSMVRAIYRTQKWVAAAEASTIAATIASYFPDVPRPRLDAACARYKALGIWGGNPVLPRTGYYRLLAGMVSAGFVYPGTPFEQAVDNSLAEAVIAANPPVLQS
jgi:NitT/TauT family transport system substrate-binding protein